MTSDKKNDLNTLIQIKVESSLKVRFQAFILAKTGDEKGMSRAIRSLILRELNKWEEAQREAKWKEEEHQAKLAAMSRKTKPAAL